LYAELNAIGRLRRGATLADVRGEMTRFFALTVPSWRIQGVARSLNDDVVGNVGRAVVAFGAAAALLLLITCINVANLLLVRGLARVRELAVRAALGAGRARLAGQLLIESALLAAAGGAVGGCLAVVAVKGFVLIAPADTPRLGEIRVGPATAAAVIGVTTLATLLFALVPSITASRVDVHEALRSGSRQSGGSRRFHRGAQSLVVAQMSLAILVLCVAGLVVRSLASLQRVPIAFDPDHLLVVELALPKHYMRDAAAQRELVNRLATRVATIPDVGSVVPVFTPPFAPVGGVFGRIAAQGQTAGERASNPVVDYEVVTPNEFATFGIPLLRGRLFTDTDREGGTAVAIVSESMARHYWPGGNAIGKRLERGPNDLITIVGVVGDTHYRDLRNPRPRVYLPLQQSPFPFAPTTLVIATKTRPSAVVPAVRRTIADAESGLAVASATPLDAYLAGALAQPRLNALLLGLFAAAATLLAAVGLFGVMATSVRQRARELSLRLALGATPHQLRIGTLRRALTIACTGAGIGLVASVVAARALRSLLYGVSAADPATLAASSVLLLAVALVAAYVPAARAHRTDPAMALRGE
jgi:predicted permease